MKDFKLSIIIPTWNRKKKLIKLLKIIIPKIKIANITYEIIICDSFSKDGTYKEVKKNFKNNKKIRFRNINFNNISKKRNEGLKLSKYPNKLFLDDDCIPLNNFFSILKKNLINCKTKQVFCGQYYTQPKLLTQSNYYKFRDFKNLKVKSIKEIRYNNIITGCCYFRLRNLKDFVKFNEKIEGYGLEDVEWAFKLSKKNYKILLTNIKVDHQETSQNIAAYLIKWYVMSRDSMTSLNINTIKQMHGRIFNFEKIFQNSFFRFVLFSLNYSILNPVGVVLKHYLVLTDKYKILYSKKLFELVLFIYYLRGACHRGRKKMFNWYNQGYK